MNVENTASIYSGVILPCGEPIHHHSKDSALVSMCDCPDKDIKFPMWLFVLKFCCECTFVFFPDAEMNGDKDTYLPFIIFHHYGNISSCYFHKELLPDHIKTCPLYMNIDNVEKGKVTTQKIIILKS